MAMSTYENPLSGQLALGQPDIQREAKLVRLLDDLRSKILQPVPGDVSWHVREAEGTGSLPLPEGWRAWPVLDDRTVWGRPQQHTWLAAEIEVPAEAANACLVLCVTSQWHFEQGSTDPQCLAYLDGELVQALDGNHSELVLAPKATAGTRHTVQVNAFTFYDRPIVGFKSWLAIRDTRVERLFHDLNTAFEVATILPQGDGRRHQLLGIVERALYALDRREGQEQEARATLARAEAIAAEIDELQDTEAQPTISAVGHTHLDVAWLWRVLHVRDKTGRSFATALNLMEEFPEFSFMYNQSVLFNYLRRDYPEIWARVKERVAAGQFDVEGAMWVEPDASLSSGESLIRQILRGRQFMIDEFGVTPRCVWLPDTFGYPASLPQIFSKSGIDFFITSKLSWNDTNRHPHDSFFWQGIDGSQIRSQLITTQKAEAKDHRTVYNSELTVSEVFGAWNRYEPKSLNDELLICYGHGDGGGGPTRDMVQRGRRLARGVAGAPKVRLEGLSDFLKRLDKKMTERASEFPVWVGELYLEYHRGTLTSVAKNKASNRNSERYLREAEFAASMATILADAFYPKDQLQEMWDLVLINQFHDILPGTSIAPVYADSDADYSRLKQTLDAPDGLTNAALNTASGGADPLRLVNFTGQSRCGDVVAFEDDDALDGLALQHGDHMAPLQRISRADGGHDWIAPVGALPTMGWVQCATVPAETSASQGPEVDKDRLENDHLRVRFNAKGEISSVFDKIRDRELLKPGETANQLVAYEDKPLAYDSWDIDRYYNEKAWPLSECPAKMDVVECGPHRAAIRIERSYAQSCIVQIVSLGATGSQLEFDTFVEWSERQTLLKALFPLDLNTSDARAEVQFGHVKRPTHSNTSWDAARFEACMHRWVDMSEPDYGAAILNDSKYGYGADGTTLSISLLKGPNYPDPEADLGEHRFRYALLVHGGESDLGQVVRAAERLNNPIRVLGASNPAAANRYISSSSFSFVEIDNPNICVETVKRAENGEGFILRLYETANRRGRARVAFGVDVLELQETDMIERPVDSPIALVDNTAALEFRPFEVKTLFMRPANVAK
ncbi:glycosyl hydrolase-related protein [Halocynthiibacter sp. C4]|uniref:alpha-mannosidase n=1 Tax=Halocynthiibacter sp. C4 TaxID=2992758 RepID=UPI00237B9CC2|nr:glycoside hydrolase family 38 C-terminal domain-containing protein [Halocynthiibacter sp. C4]MDE0591481.1 glycosyl hydrolase-related protein [Halocynthiibacter sp. C4]